MIMRVSARGQADGYLCARAQLGRGRGARTLSCGDPGNKTYCRRLRLYVFVHFWRTCSSLERVRVAARALNEFFDKNPANPTCTIVSERRLAALYQA